MRHLWRGGGWRRRGRGRIPNDLVVALLRGEDKVLSCRTGVEEIRRPYTPTPRLGGGRGEEEEGKEEEDLDLDLQQT